jgi:two-component system LytT family sensor kinase
MPGANYFMIIVLSMMFYDAAYVGELNSNSIEAALFWFNIEHIAIFMEPYLWVMMCLEYTGTANKYKKIFRYVMLPVPIMFYITFFTNHIHYLYITSFNFLSNGHFKVLTYEKNYLFACLFVYITICGLISTGLYIRGYMKSTQIYKNGYIIMVVASLFPWASVYINLTKINYLGVDLFPLVTIFSGLLYLCGIFQYNVFKTMPIATEMVYRLDQDGIAIIDMLDKIIDVNNAFNMMFPNFKKYSKKYTLSLFIKDNPELYGLAFNEIIKYSLEANGTTMHYSAELKPIIADNDLLIGKILSIKDITLFVENEKYLETIASNAMKQAETNELSFLQAQIKPHFFNNTLSIIASMITRDPNAAKELVVNLSEYLIKCYHIDTSSPQILLNEEMETIDKYVKIEKARFRERLNFIVINNNVPNIPIPRFSLQPLVENAIKHGILRQAEGGTVKIEMNRIDEYAVFKVIDTGVGISQDRIDSLLNGSEDNQGVGIINVHRRLLKSYGEGLTIQSTVGNGTTVRFSIPLKLDEKVI